MPTDEKFEDMAKGLLKAELKRRNMTYADLVGMLKRIGVKEEEHNLRNKVLSLLSSPRKLKAAKVTAA